MSEEQIDLFQVKMTSNEPVVKPPKALPDSTVTFVRDAEDPRLKAIEAERSPLDELQKMSKEMELLMVLMQTQINLLKNTNKRTYADELSLRDSLGADIPF